MPPKKRTARRNRNFRARGERHGNAKLTAQQVRAIRRDRAAHDTAFCVLADRFGISISTVGRVLRRETWAAAEYEPENPRARLSRSLGS
jgi:DNA invertase Pin-like site-specific DNA recombinase